MSHETEETQVDRLETEARRQEATKLFFRVKQEKGIQITSCDFKEKEFGNDFPCRERKSVKK
jgi:hypothetical protein